VKGTSNGEVFQNFWLHYGSYFLQPGDIVIGDNCRFHHSGSEFELTMTFLRSIDIISFRLLPKYSPELNPSEFCFSFLKQELSNYDIDCDLYLAIVEI
jgi:transposase